VHAEGGLDRVIAEIAARQRGAIRHDQLLAAGISRRGIARRLELGRLHRVFRGVYLVGHAVPPALARETCALLACGSRAVLSHRTAAALWGILDRPQVGISITIARRGPHGQPGLRVHRVGRLLAPDVARREGLPVTAPPRTLLDLASVLTVSELADTLERARVLRLVASADVKRAMERNPGRRGAAALRSLLGEQPTMTRSKAERRLLALVARAGLPRPETNVRLHGHEVDALWRSKRLVVEVDGYAFHAHRDAFERDRRRDAELQAAGYRVLRVTWRRIAHEPEALLVTLAQALAACDVRRGG